MTREDDAVPDPLAPTELHTPGGTAPSAGEGKPPSGRTSLGRFRLDAPLGSGGMGDVFRAHDTVLDRPVALKILRTEAGADDAQRRRRLLREARAAAALRHPNAVTIFDVGEDGDAVFIAMELLEGRDLRGVIERGDASTADKLRWVTDAARVLGAAHARGLVHRDVKPENMFVCADGTLKLLDFGIAKQGVDELPASEREVTSERGPSSLRTELGHRVGTPRYMAPEQLAGLPTDPRTDQYAWALVTVELLAGSLAPADMATVTKDGGADGARETWTAARVRAVAPDVPAPIAEVLGRALSQDKEARFASMEDVVAAFERGAEGTPRRKASWRSKRALALGLALSALAALALGVRVTRAPARPACRVTGGRALVLTRDDRAGFGYGGEVLVARDVSNGVLRLETDREGARAPVPVKELVAKGPFNLKEMSFFSAELGSAPAHVLALRSAPPREGDIMVLAFGAGDAWASQRVFGPAHAVAVTTFRGQPVFLAGTSSFPARPMGLPAAAEIYRMEHGWTRMEIERTEAWFPQIVATNDRVAITYTTSAGVRFAVLDEGLRPLGDVIPLGKVDSASALAFDGTRATVMWVESRGGRKRLVMASLTIGAAAFSEPKIAVDEPLANRPPQAVRTRDGRWLFSWVAARGPDAALRIAPLAADGTLAPPADVVVGPEVRDVLIAPSERADAALLWSSAHGTRHLAEVRCAPPGR